MTRTPTTIRALAASVVMVAAAGTIAAAATFHLPVLGFGSAGAALAEPPSAAIRTAPRHVEPIRVDRTRVVTSVVHRPSPTVAYAPTVHTYAPQSVRAAAPRAVAADTAAPLPTAAPPVAASAPRDGHDRHDDEGHDGSREGAAPHPHGEVDH